jgi:uncharacterized damage-inducible protein DinB
VKKTLLGITTLALLTGPVFAAEGGMTEAERAYLLKELKSSEKGMLASIDGLSPAQWTFKPAPAVWSVQECAEHIILAEEFIFSGSQKMLASPEAARLATANREGDAKIVAMIEDRSAKAKAPEAIVPSGKFPTPASAAEEFEKRRQKTIEYVTNTQDPLRVHSGQGPIGPMDSYQLLLLLAAHSARHTAQIREVEGNASYPKASALVISPRPLLLAAAVK